MNLSDSVPDLLSFHFFHSQPLPFPSPILNCYPIQLQLQPANNRPASTHHVNPTTALILLSLTGWRVPWRVHPTTTPVFLDTPPSFVQSSTTIKRNSIHSSSYYLAMSLLHCLSNGVHSLATLQHTLLHSSLSRLNAAAVAIINVFYSIVSSYLQQFVLIHMGSNGWGAISTIDSTAIQAFCTW
ncbi:predicted protein [Lichtheimia corymbifera JMRC:FSU:9682]|uniref:Uncharacterized protein n=1 Tax=Lichtheimia corymbifera JMRC:FSU:9682 TaxID=1263082 RepID=A0A068SA09_9FUNG|nr:predicted protein [Lichtheimia corymbifera JMRC:FSU:9682]